MKKKLIIVLTAILVLSTAVYAAISNGLLDAVLDGFSDSDPNDEVLEKRITFESDIPDDSKFGQYLQRIWDSTETNDEFNHIVYNYKYIETGYNAPDEHLGYIIELTLNGYDPLGVIEAYLFWTDTNEDIGIIGHMCEVREEREMDGKYWAEDAFNIITDFKYGVLDEQDIRDYYEIGMTEEDIQKANVLSRRGVFTIYEILEKRVAGEEFDIIKSSITVRPGNALVSKDIPEERLNEIMNQITFDMRSSKIMKRSELWEEQNKEAAEQMREEIKNAGVSETELEKLLDECYSYSEIIEALPSGDAKNIRGTIDGKREAFITDRGVVNE